MLSCFMIHTIFTNKNTKGFALLLSIILSSVVLAIGLSILRISVSQLQLSATARESEVAIHTSQSLNECLTYWRREYVDDFKDNQGRTTVGSIYSSVPSSVSSITCMGASPYTENHNPVGERKHDVVAVYTDGYVVRHYYTFQWDSDENDGPFCSDGELYFMVPEKDVNNVPKSFTHDFGTSVGTNGDGIKLCDSDYCGVIVTRGYNRPCDELATSIFTVQRELTFEF